jgi:thymidylate kinase
MSRTIENPHVRILGADGTGKSELCRAVTGLMPEFVAFASTDPYVYDWLRAYGIGPSSTVTPEQIELRRQVFLAANRVQMRAIKEVGERQPIVAVRGRADTIITHALLQGEDPGRRMDRLFPKPYMRPDALVVLTTPMSTIAARLAARGQEATGANDLGFLEACQHTYVGVGNLATRAFPVFVFDTNDPNNTPEHIADQVLGSIEI